MYFVSPPLRNHIFSVQKAHFFAPAASGQNPTHGDVVTTTDMYCSHLGSSELKGGQMEGGTDAWVPPDPTSTSTQEYHLF